MTEGPVTNPPNILVAEDEEAIRSLIEAILIELGYRVHTVNDGDAALAVVRSDGRRFDLLLSDIRMPGSVDGVQLATHTQHLEPDLPIVLMSGYASGSSQPPRGLPFLAKPFSVRDLIAAVETALRPAKSGK